MRFLGIGEWNSLGDMYDRLQAAGHEVRVFIEDPAAHEIFRGRLTRVDDWRAELPWIKAAGQECIIPFESAAMGERQDALRRDGFHVIGGGAYGDRLESDRRVGQRVLAEIGLKTATFATFDDFDQAREFLDRCPGRYV